MVISPVAIHIARPSSIDDTLARSIAIFVAKAAMSVLTRLFTTNMVIRNLSVLSLSHNNVFAFDLPFLMSVSIRCLGIDMIAISLPAENAEKPNNTINVIMIHELIIIIREKII